MPTAPLPTAYQALLSEQQRLQRAFWYAVSFGASQAGLIDERLAVVERRIEEMRKG